MLFPLISYTFMRLREFGAMAKKEDFCPFQLIRNGKYRVPRNEMCILHPNSDLI